MSPPNKKVAKPFNTRSIRFSIAVDDLLDQTSGRLGITINAVVNQAVTHFASVAGVVETPPTHPGEQPPRAFFFPWICDECSAMFFADGPQHVTTCPQCKTDHHCQRVYKNTFAGVAE
jgi:hypothetical protein